MIGQTTQIPQLLSFDFEDQQSIPLEGKKLQFAEESTKWFGCFFPTGKMER